MGEGRGGDLLAAMALRLMVECEAGETDRQRSWENKASKKLRVKRKTVLMLLAARTTLERREEMGKYQESSSCRGEERRDFLYWPHCHSAFASFPLNTIFFVFVYLFYLFCSLSLPPLTIVSIYAV